MTARLGYSPAERHPSFDLLSKNVDEGPKTQGFSATSLSGLGYLGHGAAREIVLRNTAVGRHRSSDSADRMLVANVPPLSATEILAADTADLDDEDLDSKNIADALPTALGDFLRRMPAGLRKAREDAILREIGWEGVSLVDLDPMMLATSAETRARQYAMQFPRFDENGNPINRQPEHNRGRCEKVQRRRLKRIQNRALLYIEAAVGAVGGPAVPGRPLYVSDYSVDLYRQDAERTEEILKGLRLVNVGDPSVQIPMNDLNAAARVRDAAKRRLMIDLHLARWKELGWYVCWITITLPGKYVPHATNEANRVSSWDDRLGPMEAMADLQADHHRVMAAAREAGVRPCGWWNAQPQQSGVGHRHYVVACQTTEQARLLCDHFRAKFSSRRDGDDVQDRGCRAYVLGDDDADYRAPKGKNGERETAESVAKYAARYSTRCETASVADDDGEEEKAIFDGGEQDRFRDWKRRRAARTHTWLGLDSGRAPSELWDTLWMNSLRSDTDPDDPRMALAMQHMRRAQAFTAAAVECRARVKDFPVGDDDRQAEIDAAKEVSDFAAREAWHAAIAIGLWPDTDLDPMELEWLRTQLPREADPLPPVPLRQMRESVYGEQRKEIVGAIGVVERFRLSPKPKRIELLEAASTVGLDAWRGKSKGWLMKELKTTGIRFSKRPDGTLAGYELGGEILLRTEDEWRIVDQETACQMFQDHKEDCERIEEMQRNVARLRSKNMDRRLRVALRTDVHVARSREVLSCRRAVSAVVCEGAAGTALNRGIAMGTVGLSFSPTDPRLGASPPPSRDWDEILHILTDGLEAEPEPPGTPSADEAKIVDAKALREMQQRKGFDRL